MLVNLILAAATLVAAWVLGRRYAQRFPSLTFNNRGKSVMLLGVVLEILFFNVTPLMCVGLFVVIFPLVVDHKLREDEEDRAAGGRRKPKHPPHW